LPPIWHVAKNGLLSIGTYFRLATDRKQNALFNSALRQSTSIRKDLDQFADLATPSPHLQAQLNASLATFARTVDDYAKLAKQEPVQTKQEKAFERLKNFRSELDGYRDNFKRIKSANEDIVC
jgi:Golgi SNAP receptor complex protein 2